MVQMGTYEELMSSSLSFARLLEDINQHEQDVEQEVEQEINILHKRSSKVDSISTEKCDEEQEDKPLATNIEIKQEGIVKWAVYVSYLRAGISLGLGGLILLTVYIGQQAISLASIWWFAEWSNDESHRYRVYNNCSTVNDPKTNRIRFMTEIEWNEHRNRRFYISCG